MRCTKVADRAALQWYIYLPRPGQRERSSTQIAMNIIAVLEDDQRRISEIRAAVKQHFSAYDLRVFISAREMITWLVNTPRSAGLLSLDCDLDLTSIDDGECRSGEAVTAYLASNLPECPVLIHSSNAMRAPAMHMELALAGCKRVALCPFQDSDSWAKDVRDLLNAE